jgi:hypothetical protein
MRRRRRHRGTARPGEQFLVPTRGWEKVLYGDAGEKVGGGLRNEEATFDIQGRRHYPRWTPSRR